MAIPTGISKTAYSDGSECLHLGNLFDGTRPFHAGAYTYNGVSVSAHYWNSRWRHGPPIVITRSPAQIVAANRMFPMGDTGCKIIGTDVYADYTGPMSPAWVTVYMPTTGERIDIGLVTDPGARFMLGQSPSGMIAGLMASASFPHHYRDERTGKPVDLLKYPQANCYESPAQGAPWFQRYPLNPDGSNDLGGGMVAQQAHFCDMAYLAYQATGNPFALEELQYGANFVVLCDAAHSTPTTAYMTGELRGIAWGLGMLFKAHAATQDAEAVGTLPASCHPSSYWKKILDSQLAYYTARMTDPANQVFRLLTGPGLFGPWQQDYLMTALAFGVLSGHSDWVPLYLWALKNPIDRTSGKSGYPVGWGTAYYMNGALPDWKSAWLAMYPSVGSPPPTPDQILALQFDQYNGRKTITGGEYNLTTRAVLVMAQYLHKLGLVDVKAVYPDLDLCFTNMDLMVRAGGWMNARASYVLDASQAPTTIPPLPPVVIPPVVTPPSGEPPKPPATPPPAVLPRNVHGLLLRAQKILARV